LVLTRDFQPVTTKDRVAALIKQAMLSGQLQPGERIVELRLAKQLGLGTTSIREALFQLERQGFVTRIAHKGAYVIELSREERQQVGRVRKELEGLAVELLTPQVGQPEIVSVQGLLDEMRTTAREGDVVRFYEKDLAFHRALWELSQNKYVCQFLEGIVAPLFAFYVIRTNRDSASLVEATESHQRILDAIKQGDPLHARSVMEELLQFYSAQDDEFVPEKKR
jgi:DNA-binding GntR family transcriptional regulator